jgi:DNA-binding Lrp family transcriptional regulator
LTSKKTKQLHPIDRSIIAELIRNPRQSDRQLAGKLGSTQPTITRRRLELEKKGFLDYTSSTNLPKLGYELLAITLGNRASHPEHPELQIEKINDFIEKHPQCVLVSSGRGLGADRVIVSVHKDYTDYDRFQQEFKREWTEFMTIMGSFIISLVSDSIPRHLTLKSLTELIEKN